MSYEPNHNYHVLLYDLIRWIKSHKLIDMGYLISLCYKIEQKCFGYKKMYLFDF